MANQYPVKSRGTFPYLYVGGDGLTKNSARPGIEGLAYDAFVDPSGNLWVHSAGTTEIGGIGPSGSVTPLLVDAQGRTYLAPPSQVTLSSTSAAYETSRVIKSSPGTLFGLTGYNSKVSSQFILLFDYANSGTVPANGQVPVTVVSVGAGANFSIDFGFWGRAFSAGIVVANSSTAQTLTIGSADCWFDCQYV